MYQNGSSKILYLALGAALGGLTGYLIGDLVAYKLVDENLQINDRFYLLKNFLDETLDLGAKKDSKPKVNYGNTKPALDSLAKPYRVSDDTPRIITVEDWASAHPMNDKVMVSYYEDDTTYAMEDDELIDAPENLFGPNIHLHFGEESEDPDVVYVRNDRSGTDYEITRIHGSYKALVMGEPEEEPKPKPKRASRSRKKVEHDEEDSEE